MRHSAPASTAMADVEDGARAGTSMDLRRGAGMSWSKFASRDCASTSAAQRGGQKASAVGRIFGWPEGCPEDTNAFRTPIVGSQQTAVHRSGQCARRYRTQITAELAETPRSTCLASARHLHADTPAGLSIRCGTRSSRKSSTRGRLTNSSGRRARTRELFDAWIDDRAVRLDRRSRARPAADRR